LAIERGWRAKKNPDPNHPLPLLPHGRQRALRRRLFEVAEPGLQQEGDPLEVLTLSLPFLRQVRPHRPPRELELCLCIP